MFDINFLELIIRKILLNMRIYMKRDKIRKTYLR